jgi:hypothetical protein
MKRKPEASDKSPRLTVLSFRVTDQELRKIEAKREPDEPISALLRRKAMA